MKAKDRVAWRGKTARLNSGRTLAVGMAVTDSFGAHGIIVKIEPATLDHHGTIYVWKDQQTGYGADNCEHYSFEGWQSELRVDE